MAQGAESYKEEVSKSVSSIVISVTEPHDGRL